MSGRNLRCLHLSHSDVRVDSRILKALQVSVEQDWLSKAVGLEIWEQSQSPTSDYTEVCGSRALRAARWLERGSKPSGPERLGCQIRPVMVKFLKRVTIIELLLQISVRSVKFRPNVVHCHDFYLLPVAYGVAKLFRARLVYDAHELESQTNGISTRLSWVCRKIERLSWSRVDRFITVSESIKTWYLNEYGYKPSEVILNSPKIGGIRTTNAQVMSNLRTRYGIASEQSLGLYIGGLQSGRGIPQILTFAERFQDQIAVVFMGGGNLASTIQAHSNFGINVFLHEPVPHERVVDYAKSADFGFCLIEDVSLSDHMCLPNKLFEYAFSGLRVIASDLPEIKALVESRNLGAVVALDEPGITVRLAEVAEMMRANAGKPLTADLRDLSWEAQSLKLRRLYASLTDP